MARSSSRWLRIASSVWVVTVLAVPLRAQPQRPPVALERASAEVPESELLDVGIQVFSPGLPPISVKELEEKGIFADVRRSEARFTAVLLAATLQETGFWGAVRVVPSGVAPLDLAVTGTIAQSTGLRLELEIEAVDATGRRWLKKRYKRFADDAGYDKAALDRTDPYQDVYDEIANDLLAARRRFHDRIVEIRRVSNLRFAADLAPAAFAGTLGRNQRGHWQVERLPAEDEPMLARLAEIRERDYMLVDALHQYYLDFRQQMETPYGEWRLFSYEEELALRRLKRETWAKRIGGIVAIVGGVLAEGDSRATGAARQGAIIAGELLLRDSFAKSAEARMHREAINELAASFEAEVQPMVVEIEGETLRLTGSAETQYAEWRRLLGRLWQEETGAPVDPNTGETIEREATAEETAPVDAAGGGGRPR